MVSGLPQYFDLGDVHTNEDVVKVLADAELAFPTGSKFEYSNTDYNLLATLVGRASNTSFADFVGSNIFAPLGMKDSYILMKKERTPNRVRGYKVSGSKIALDEDDTPGIVGDGSAISTAGDLIKYEQALRSGDIDESVVGVWLQAGPKKNEDGEPYAMGWRLSSLDGHDRVIHNGAWNGTSTCMARYKDGLTVIVLLNVADGGAEGLADEVARLFFE